MKNFIIKKCMNYIEKNTNYKKDRLKEIEYGLIGVYLTLSKLLFIMLLSLILGIFKEVIIFISLFNLIRMPAFGLHATKSWICLLGSSIGFIGVPLICIHLKINIYLKIIICIICVILMLKNAPADTHKRPIISKKRRLIYKSLSTILSVIFSVIAIFINNNFISNSLIFSIILENILISPFVYKLFNLPYNNYLTYLKNHPELTNY